MIPYGKQTINLIDIWNVVKQLRSKSLTQGPKTKQFETAIAAYTGAKYAVAVSSATAGLHLAVKALELENNSIIATSPISFVASSNAALFNGLKPEFIDISRHDMNISLELLKQKLDGGLKISAVIAVHFSGFPCQMLELSALAKKYNFKIIEDAAHALGGTYIDGSKIGNSQYSEMCVFSLHPVKAITSGEGGVVTTNNHDLYVKLLRLRSHGINKENDTFVNQITSKTNNKNNLWYYEMIEIGYNYRLTDIQSALALSQLKKLDKFIMKRRKAATKYLKYLEDITLINLPINNKKIHQSGMHLFFIEIDFTKLKISRNELMTELKKRGIGSQVHYIPIPMQPYYKNMGFSMSNIPRAMDYYMRTLSIPLFPNLKNRQIKYVAKTIKKIISENKL